MAAGVRRLFRILSALSLVLCLVCTMLWMCGGSFTLARATAMANWFYKHGDAEIGPIDERTIRAWVKGGSIARSQLVRSDASAEWQRADVCFSDLFPKSKAPDLLAQVAARYFECDGLCFFPVLDVVDGYCRANLFYQNRFSGNCRAEVSLSAVPNFWSRSANKKTLVFEINCSGGEYGVVSRFCGINSRWQGKTEEFNIEGKATYPQGKGDLLRIERGLSAQGTETSDTVLLGLLAIISLGHLMVHHESARVCLALPDGVPEEVPDDWPQDAEILWTMDEAATQQSGK